MQRRLRRSKIQSARRSGTLGENAWQIERRRFHGYRCRRSNDGDERELLDLNIGDHQGNVDAYEAPATDNLTQYHLHSACKKWMLMGSSIKSEADPTTLEYSFDKFREIAQKGASEGG